MASVVIPEIETERLILRAPISTDLDVFAAYLGDPDYLRYLPRRTATPHERAEQTLNVISQVWEQQPPSDIAWVISQKAGGQLMGWSGAGSSAGDGEIELVYAVGKPFWGQGFATEAARAVVRFGFENTGWDRMVAAIIPGNVASRRVLEHLGFVYEKDVNYYEMSGDATIEMDSPIVPYFALQRGRFAPGDAFYRVRHIGSRQAE
jgi:RimJ/RimL family protein N-acetyltransferase